MSANMISPTAITNSFPRPKSPRRPDNRGDNANTANDGNRHTNGRSTPTAFVAAEAFQRALDGTAGAGQCPRIRRRHHQEMGRFAGNLDPPSNAEQRQLCMPGINMHDLKVINNNAANCVVKSVDKSNEYAVRYAPATKQSILRCSSATADGMTDAAAVAADIYRRECRTNNRGDDSMFFLHNNYDHIKESNSMVETVSTTTDDVSRSPPNEGSKDSTRTRTKPSEPEQPFRSPRSMRFPEAIHVMKDPAADLDMSPPKVDRINTSNAWPNVFEEPQAPHGLGLQENTNLREARLQLLKSSYSDSTEQEARLGRALEDLNRQDELIGRLQRDLQIANDKCEQANKELEETRAVAQQRQFAATEIRARAVQDRKRMEETLERETQTSRRLHGIISQMQVETSGLKVALRNARSEGARKPRQPEGTTVQDNNKNPQSPSVVHPPRGEERDSSVSSPNIITLRAEIVELRSQLAEARAAKLEDNSSLHGSGELEQLRSKLAAAEKEISQLREKQRMVGKLEDRHQQTENLLREKLERLQASTKESKTKLEERLKEVIASENDIKAELIKTKASLHRLERERTQKRLKSNSELDRMNKQLAKANEESENLKNQLDKEKETFKGETKNLKTEIADLKQKLSQSNQESLLKSTEHLKERRKLQKELDSKKKEVESLQENIASQARKTADLAATLSRRADRPSDLSSVNSVNSEQQLRDELRLRKANEAALRAEIKIQKTLVQQMKAETKEKQSQTKESEQQLMIEQLRNQIAALKRSKESDDSASLLAKAAVTEAKLMSDIDELKKVVTDLQEGKKVADASDRAKEQAYLNDICVLKASLNEAEERCKEEKFRADEERRIGQEMEAERVAEIERVRRENERVLSSEARLLEEIKSLRSNRNKSSGLEEGPGPIPSVSSNTGKPVSKELPENVLRLRKELALARARLAAAREDSRSAALKHTLPASPEKSVASTGSTWAPPVQSVVADESREPLPIVSQKSSESSMSVPLSETTKANEQLAGQNETKKANFDDLQRRLRESSQRLCDANSKLKGLVRGGDFRASENLLKRRLDDPVVTLVRVNSGEESSLSGTSGVIEEVRLSTDCIEVTEKRFFDI